MKKLFESFQITLSTFSVIPPVKYYDWTTERIRFMPIFLPVVGLILGAISYLVLVLLQYLDVSNVLKAIIMLFVLNCLTGGVHLDGLMDSSDAYFSRRDKEKKLEIMKDSRVGSFAVIVLLFYLFLQFGVINEFINKEINPIYLLYIPVYSRIMVSVMNYKLPFAREEGLSVIFGKALVKKDFFILVAFMILTAYFNGTVLPIIFSLLSLIIFSKSALKNFGGVTGDLLGSYIMINDLLMLIVVVLGGVGGWIL